MGLTYESHARNASLLEVLKESRVRDKIMGYSLRGIHKDELNMLLGDFPIKRRFTRTEQDVPGCTEACAV